MNKDDKFLKVVREYRIVSVALTIFVLWWGYDAYLFVNEHFSDIKDFALLFYTSIITLAGWVVKNWMSTKHNDGSGKSDE